MAAADAAAVSLSRPNELAYISIGGRSRVHLGTMTAAASVCGETRTRVSVSVRPSVYLASAFRDTSDRHRLSSVCVSGLLAAHLDSRRRQPAFEKRSHLSLCPLKQIIIIVLIVISHISDGTRAAKRHTNQRESKARLHKFHDHNT